MQALLKATRHALPVLFLGYAVMANWSIFSDGLDPVEGDLLTGGMTAQFGGLYSEAQPHREVAISGIGAARYLVLGEGREGVTVGKDGWLFTDEEFDRATPEEIAGAVREITDAAAVLADHGARLVVIPVPAKIDIHRAKGDAAAGAAMEAQYAAFRDALEAQDIAVADTRPALLAAVEAAPVFLARDTHWSPEGAARAAEAVAASGLVPAGQTDFEKRADVPREITGDLVSFVTSDRFATVIGLAPERVTPYVAENPEPAQGGIFATAEETPETVLVGTSYSANPDWSFVPALQLALRRDILNLAEQGLGPVAPMRALLEAGASGGTWPRVVLWEYPVRYLGAAPQDERKG